MRYYPASLYTKILDYFVDDPNYSLQVCLVGGFAVPLEGLSPTYSDDFHCWLRYECFGFERSHVLHQNINIKGGFQKKRKKNWEFSQTPCPPPPPP